MNNPFKTHKRLRVWRNIQFLQGKYALVFWVILILSIMMVYISIATDTISREYFYNSDALYIPTLYRDFFSEYGILGWSLQPAPSFFPDILLYGIIRAIVGNFHLAIMLYGVIQILIFIGSLLYLSNKVFQSRESLHSLILFAGIVFFLVVSTGKFNAFLPILKNGHHFGAMLILVISLALVVQILRGESDKQTIKLSAVVLGILSTAIMLSDAIYLVQFLLPVMLSVLLLFLFSMISGKTALLASVCLLPSIPISYLVNELFLRFWRPQLKPIGTTMTEMTKTISKTIQDILFWPEIFWCSPEYLSILQIVWIAFVLVSIVSLVLCLRASVKQKKRLTQDSRYVFVLSFFLFSMLINIAAALLTGNSHPRHFIPTLIIPLFFGWPFLFAGFHKVVTILEKRAVIYGLFGITLLLLLGFGVFSNIRNISALSQLSDYYPDFIQCLDQNTKTRNIHSGMSQYWWAKHSTMLSKNNLHIVQVVQGEKDLFIDHWINNVNWYNHDFEFIIADEEVKDLRTIDEEKVIRRFGEVADMFLCGKRKILVYNRTTDVDFQKQFSNKSFFSFEFYASQLPSEVGKLSGLSRIATEESDKSGCLTYGPYLNLFIGDYYFEIHYYAKKNTTDKSVGKWDVVIHTSDEVESQSLQKGKIEKEGNNIISGVFKVRKTGVAEIRVRYQGRGTLRVDKIQVRKIR